jgi:hypothetical protein
MHSTPSSSTPHFDPHTHSSGIPPPLPRRATNTPRTIPPDTSSSNSHGLRAQIHQLMPRHAYFNVRVTIHEISSVPLVRGEFGVKWKFKNVQKAKNPLFGIRKTSKGKEPAHPSLFGGSTISDQSPDDSSSVEHGSVGTGTSPIPSVVISSHSHPSSLTSRSSSSHSLYAPSINTSLSHPSSSESNHISSSSNNRSSNRSTPASSTPPSYTEPESASASRGITEFKKLRDHRVGWEHTVDAVIKMDVERTTSNLLPNELKLVVMQRVVPGDPDAPHNPRLGAIYLNLAEYADAGIVTRRYLLRESKTNTVLKLSIHVQQLDSDKTIYKAPPLPRGEILTGVTRLLESEVHRTRPTALNLFDGFPTDDPSYSRPSLIRDKSSSGLPKYDIEKLPYASGPKTTHDIIEALFNPVPTTSKSDVTPFTYLVEPVEYKAAKADWVTKNKPSATNLRDSLQQEESGAQTELDGGLGKPKWWSKSSKVQSRPETPQLVH